MKIMQRLAEVAARVHLAPSTAACYRRWIMQFLEFNRRDGQWVHPRELGAAEVERFLTHLARQRRMSSSSQNQATNALVFLYKQVLAGEVAEDHLGRFAAERARRPHRVPTVLTENERRIFAVGYGALGFWPWALERREGGLARRDFKIVSSPKGGPVHGTA